MNQERRRESWELAAEQLVRRVRTVLDDHREALEKALRKKLSKDEAHSQIRQLEHFVEALEIELWRTSTPRRSIGHHLASSLKVGLGTIAVTILTLGTTDLYKEVIAAESTAGHVISCVVHGRDADPHASDDALEPNVEAGDRGAKDDLAFDKAFAQQPAFITSQDHLVAGSDRSSDDDAQLETDGQSRTRGSSSSYDRAPPRGKMAFELFDKRWKALASEFGALLTHRNVEYFQDRDQIIVDASDEPVVREVVRELRRRHGIDSGPSTVSWMQDKESARSGQLVEPPSD